MIRLALAAVLAGARSFTAIGEWAAELPEKERAMLGAGGLVPSESTIRRCLQQPAPDSLDTLVGAWMWLRTSVTGPRRVIAFDGKALLFELVGEERGGAEQDPVLLLQEQVAPLELAVLGSLGLRYTRADAEAVRGV